MNRIETEVKALQKFRKAVEEYSSDKITKKELDRKIDSIVYDVFTELDMIPLRETFYRYKTYASESWPDLVGPIGM